MDATDALPHLPLEPATHSPVFNAAATITGGDSATEERRDPLEGFERFLLTCCSFSHSDDELWRRVAEDIAARECKMDPHQAVRFEISVDYVLSRLGLPGWTVVKAHADAAKGQA